MSKVQLPSLTGFGNQALLLVINAVLSLAFIDQLYNHDLPCPLCILQRVGFTLIGLMILLNLRSYRLQVPVKLGSSRLGQPK